MDPAGTEFRNTKELVKGFAKETKMSPDLRHGLLEYIDEMEHKIRQEYYVRLLDLLSPTLRGRVCQHVYGKSLQRVSFFGCDDERERRSFTMAVAGRLQVVIFGRSEVIVSAGTSCDSLSSA